MKPTRVLALLFVLVLPLVALACRSTGDALGPGGVPFQNLQRGYMTGLREPGVRVAHNAAEWNEMWARHTSVSLSRPPLLVVDWSRDMVVCATIGDRPTAGFGLEIKALRVVDGVLHVEAVETKPDASAKMPQIVTQPYHMVTTVQSNATVVLDLN